MDWSPIAAGFKCLLPAESSKVESCCDNDGLIVDAAVGRLADPFDALAARMDDPAGLGYNIDTTLTGNYAVMPQMTGLMVGVIHSGGATRPFQSPIRTYAYFNGTTTRVSFSQTTSPGGDQLENVGYANSNDLIYVIDVSPY